MNTFNVEQMHQDPLVNAVLNVAMQLHALNDKLVHANGNSIATILECIGINVDDIDNHMRRGP